VTTSRETAVATRPAALSAGDREAMFALLDHHFEGVTAAQFARDLDEKDWVLRLFDAGVLVGFTTLQVYASQQAGRRISVAYSGDTIVAPEAWGSSALARGWGALVWRLRAAEPASPWYWLLLSSGFRTYRFLPVFCREFWPRHDEATPPHARQLLVALARERFGASFDAAAGIVRFAAPQRLRGALALVPEGKAHDPHVAFFVERNPAYAAGDELVCLAELHDDNLTAAGRRMVRGAPS
jgi:hypothetical protein